MKVQAFSLEKSISEGQVKVDPMSRPILSFFKLHFKFNSPSKVPCFIEQNLASINHFWAHNI